MDLLQHTEVAGPAPRGRVSVVTDVSRSPVDLEVVIPAFDEEDRLEATMSGIVGALSPQPWSSRVVVVDNGSTDGTSELADRWGDRFRVQVIGCSRQGKGAAVRRGFLTSPARWVGYCDADGAALAKLIVPAVHLLAAGHPVVIGSYRSLPRWFRRDVGFEFFHAEQARRIVTRSHLTGPAFDLELLALARNADVPVVELPVRWHDRHGSTLRTVGDRFRAHRELWRLHILGPEPIDVLQPAPALLPPPAEGDGGGAG
ncbi:glycosyltransferase [Actinoplanes sp. NPDC049316]|uniref:glycosyltransferase n=1 Tax=Actinoplanes sp. NPDC049316 TaxID=3154727 RepID=UPI00343A7C06